MLHKVRFLQLTAMVFALSLATSVASASTIVVTAIADVAQGDTEFTGLSGANPGILTFAQFNSSLGTLTSITFSLDVYGQSVITVTNGDTTGSNGEADSKIRFQVQDPDSLLTVDSSGNANLLVFPNDGETDLYTLGAGDSVTLNGGSPFTDTATLAQTTSAAGILAEFTGGGTINLGLTTVTQTDLANTGGNSTESQVTQAAMNGVEQITYTYTAASETPEPGTMTLFGAALLGFGLIGRKRLANRQA